MLLTTNPQTGETRQLEITHTSKEEVERLANSAAKASRKLAAGGRELRIRMLNSIAEHLEKNRETLIEAAHYETALGLPRLNGELTRTIYQLKEFAQIVAKGTLLEPIIDHPSDSDMGPKPDLRRILIPIGPIAVFGASNFPFAFSVCGGDTAAAIAAGNSVVVKAHSSHLETATKSYEAMRDAFIENGFEEDAVGIVYGQDAGRYLVEADPIAAVGFTGSLGGGRFLFDVANSRKNPIPFYGELGSVNPLVVTEAAIRERGKEIAHDYANSVTLGGGQFCTKPGLIFIPENSTEEFQDELKSVFSEQSPVWLLNKSTYDSYNAETEALTKNSLFNDLTLGQDSEDTGFSVSPKLFWATLDQIKDVEEVLYQECFGPFAIAVTYSSIDEVTETLQNMPGALAAAIHAEESDIDAVRELATVLQGRVGRVLWNGYPTGVAVSWSQTHGGPYPSSTSAIHTSVGATAIRRFMRPVSLQNFPEALLPDELKDQQTSDIKVSGRIVDTVVE